MKRALSRLFAVIFPLIFICVTPVQADDYKIGVLAKRGAAKAMKKWSATAEYLTKTISGHQFSVVPLDFEEVFTAIENQKVDFFLVNSSMFVTAKVKYGAEAIVTMINSRQGQALKSFGGVIFTYVDRDDINGLEDLKGKRFMAVKKSSFGGWQMAYKVLLDQGIDPAKDFSSLEFGGSHDNVVYAVQNGEFDAGMVRTDTLERMAAVGDINLDEFKVINRVNHANFPFLASTPLYSEWPFAKTASTSEEIAGQVATALRDMPTESKAAKDAKIVGWSQPQEYDGVERLQEMLQVGAYQ